MSDNVPRPTPRARISRRSLASILAVAVAAATTLIAVVIWDRDSEATTPGETHQAFTATIGPTKGTHTSLLTPPGNGWWDLTTSLAPSLYLWDTTPPGTARWYGLTAGRSYAARTKALTAYQAVHIGFATPRQARRYAARTYATINSHRRVVLHRGNVVTFTASWIDPAGEPYKRANADLRTAAATLTPTVGTWTSNIGEHFANLNAHSDYAENLDRFIANLGFTEHTTWQAQATAPEGPWAGTLTNFQSDKIDVAAASKAITDANVITCDPTGQTCQIADEPLFDLTGSITLYDHVADAAFGSNKYYLPEDVPKGTRLSIGINYGVTEGIITDTTDAPQPPVKVIKIAITDENQMTLSAPPSATTP